MDRFSNDDAVEVAIAVGIVVGSLILARLVAALLRRIVQRFFHQTTTELDDIVADALRTPLIFAIVTFGLYLGARTISELDDQRDIIDRIYVASTIALLFIAIRSVVLGFVGWFAGRADAAQIFDTRTLPMVTRVINIVLFIVGALVVLDTVGIAINPLLTGLGLGGLAVALALSPLLSNVFASSFLISDASIRSGDFIEIEGGPSGWVEDIGWRATRIRTFSNNIVIIPNASLAESTVTNFDTEGEPVDASVTCGVAYEEDLARVEEVCLEVLREVRDSSEFTVKEQDPVFLFQSFGDSNIDFLMKVRANDRRNLGRVAHLMVKGIHARLNAEGITINYPARRVLLEEDDTGGFERLIAGARAAGD
jgi:small-conductance mechanosensitive channel